MYIKKIIKFYFISSLIVTAAYIGPHVGNKEDFMANVLGMEPGNSAQESEQGTSRLEITLADSDTLNYVKPGQKEYNVMDLKIKNLGDDLRLDTLNFKILDLDPLAIDKAVLMQGDVAIVKARRKDDMLIFSKIDLDIPKNTEVNLSLLIDLNPSLTPGTRFQIQIFSDKQEFSPLMSSYTTVINQRPKFRVIYK
ncbi:MAG: hypothetical protein WC269_01860 [Candidatus Gracilibacteria bacterium]|jgi:hypothetical protein